MVIQDLKKLTVYTLRNCPHLVYINKQNLNHRINQDGNQYFKEQKAIRIQPREQEQIHYNDKLQNDTQ